MGEGADALTDDGIEGIVNKRIAFEASPVSSEIEMKWKHLLAFCNAMGELGIDKKIVDVEAAGQKPVAILMPDKPEFAWVRGIAQYRDLPVQFAPVIVEPEVAYRYVELSERAGELE